MENFDALDVIARTRGKVDMGHTTAKDDLFLLWGTLGALFVSLEFVLWQFYRAEWCRCLWIGIPLIGLLMGIGVSVLSLVIPALFFNKRVKDGI